LKRPHHPSIHTICIPLSRAARWTSPPAQSPTPDTFPRTTSTKHGTNSNKTSQTLTVKVTLHAFAAERRHLLHGARSCRSISPARRALSSKPTGRRCCSRSMGQTDARPFAPHTMSAASITSGVCPVGRCPGAGCLGAGVQGANVRTLSQPPPALSTLQTGRPTALNKRECFRPTPYC